MLGEQRKQKELYNKTIQCCKCSKPHKKWTPSPFSIVVNALNYRSEVVGSNPIIGDVEFVQPCPAPRAGSAMGPMGRLEAHIQAPSISRMDVSLI